MAELFDMKELEERVILVAVSTSDEDDTEASLDELEELADTAGATAIGRLVQNREKIHPGTYLGSGKIGELREMVWEMGATGVICDDELSQSGIGVGYEGNGPDDGHSRYFRGACDDE